MAAKRKAATIDDVLSRFDSIDRWRVTVQARIDKHDKTLYGNGEPGHDEMIRDIYSFIGTQKTADERRRSWWDKFQWVIIPLVIGGIVTFVWQALVFYFQVFPAIEKIAP